MREAFSQHFATDQDRREKLWENCLFVFDTNVLVGIYRRSEEARDAQYKMMVELGERLWIPHRVIYEFLDNRAKIVHEQSQLYADSISELRGMLSSFEIVTKHPFLSVSVYEEFNKVSQKVLDELEQNRMFHEGRITNDDVKLRLADIFEGKVGLPFSEEKLIDIVKGGEVRYAQNIPPGFEDRTKHKGSTITEEVRKRYGDLIIWYQIIDKAKAEQRPVILVTGDQKPDWWAEQSGKKLGPHPSLINEFKVLSGQDFYLYSYHSFLDLANKYLDQKTSAAVIEEVRESALMESEPSEGDESAEEQEVYDVGGALIDSQGERFCSSDLEIYTNPRSRALISEEIDLQQRIHEVERKIKSNNTVLRAMDLGAKSSGGTYIRLKKSLEESKTLLKLYKSRLNFVRVELLRYRGMELR
ncbi:PIN-like domain-containing protein [Pseudomonas viridiflava]|uniref:PIN-like domain-containing protein n=3 Tax=Pseudomonas viridiflava TaxID=33069 RepID=UPI000F03B9E6|nr:PIN-like domain-containing protein [Pseudomonas viridiflava]